MKKTLVFTFLFLVSSLFAGFEVAQAARVMTLKIGKGQALVYALDGSAQVLREGRRDWRPLRVKDLLKGGDEVTTGPKSRIELVMPDNSRVRFADNSRFKILQIEAGEEAKPRNVRIHLAFGRTWANVSRAVGRGDDQFRLSCENAVAGVRGTVYRMNVDEDQSALVRVYDGQVDVAGGGEKMGKSAEKRKPYFTTPTKVEGPKQITMEQWTELLRSMQQIAIKKDGSWEKRDFTEAEDRDAWVDWNKQRDTENNE